MAVFGHSSVTQHHSETSMAFDNRVPKSLITSDLTDEFQSWARDGGYDESYFDRWDSKSLALEEEFLAERLSPQTTS
jgi:hypothetical protein